MASQLNISIRTLYRDIALLQAQGAAVDGEPGVGYILRPGFMLPPLMFSQSELEALVLGARWVTKFTDASMTESAENALAKISDVLPQELRQELEHNTLLVGPKVFKSTETVDLGVIRQSIRQ